MTATAVLKVDDAALTRLNRKLADYVKVNKRYTVPEVLDKKGNDLRIQCFKLFREERFGGSFGKKNGIAWRELRRRAKAGIGTLVRQKELQGRWGAPPPQTAGKNQKAHKLSAWQQLVWQETTRRQKGIGAFAASFLNRRWRHNKVHGRYLVENKSRTIGTMATFAKDETSFTISGFTPGMAEIANRYNIANRAIAEVEKDMDKYLNRKHAEAMQMVFSR